jgi:hypothetical protein
MAIPTILPCDGCGQLASTDHLARRLQRLEWATRFRPIHIQVLLLSAAVPESDADFLYNPQTRFTGMAAQILAALEVATAGKSAEEVLNEFQKRGLVFASALECPVETSVDAPGIQELMERHLPQTISRIRRSFKPKRVLVISPDLRPFLSQLNESALGCPVLYTPLTAPAPAQALQTAEIAAFRSALAPLAAHGT